MSEMKQGGLQSFFVWLLWRWNWIVVWLSLLFLSSFGAIQFFYELFIKVFPAMKWDQCANGRVFDN